MNATAFRLRELPTHLSFVTVFHFDYTEVVTFSRELCNALIFLHHWMKFVVIVNERAVVDSNPRPRHFIFDRAGK